MARFIKGKRFGDQDDISKALAEERWDKGVLLVTRLPSRATWIIRVDQECFLSKKVI